MGNNWILVINNLSRWAYREMQRGGCLDRNDEWKESKGIIDGRGGRA